MDRVEWAPPVGLSAKDVTLADYVLVGHAHFDHLAGAEHIAMNTGAKIIGSDESCRVMRDRGVPREQLLVSEGGERHRLAPDVTVRVFPSLHACTWILGEEGCGDVVTGHLGLDQDQRAQQPGLNARIGQMVRDDPRGPQLMQHIRESAGSISHGGALVYLIETPGASIFYQDTSGIWTGVVADLHADIAVLAASGRPNVNGEPIQGSLAGFVGQNAATLGAKKVVLGHHDDWMPPVTNPAFDMQAVRDTLASAAPDARLAEMGYLEPTRLDG
jgi:L-ascorbate metabolism protein UlaG (beta-lactamase superfamily)